MRMMKQLAVSAFTMAGLWMAGAAPAWACPNCYSSALGEKGLHAIKSGILILLLPTMALFGAIMVLTFRRRDPESAGFFRHTPEEDLLAASDPLAGCTDPGVTSRQ
jgi:hypothetical protein